jgi:signal transduction histidine kinase
VRSRLSTSARVRLTAAVTVVFLLGGTALTGVAYTLVKRHLPTKPTTLISIPKPRDTAGLLSGRADVQSLMGPKAEAAEQVVQRALGQANANAMHQILVYGIWALLAMTALVGLLGWLMTGRALRPVHAMIASQRRFAANASHELRTPLAVQRAAIQIGLEDPTPSELAEIRKTMLAANTRTLQLIEGLLLLARSEGGLHEREHVRLDEIVAEEAARREDLAERHDVHISTRTEPRGVGHIIVRGDRVLLGQLVGNLMQNAIHYNRPGGDVEIVIGAEGSIRIENPGPVIDPEEIGRIFEPFHRGRATRTAAPAGPDGAGLGLSIVRAITEAHGGRVHAAPGPDGGLRVVISLA